MPLVPGRPAGALARPAANPVLGRRERSRLGRLTLDDTHEPQPETVLVTAGGAADRSASVAAGGPVDLPVSVPAGGRKA